MKLLQMTLADLIRRGKVTVEIPGLDMAQLRDIIDSANHQLLSQIMYLTVDDQLTDREKVEAIQARLDVLL